MAKNILTQKKFDELTQELQERKTTRRDEISKAIKKPIVLCDKRARN